MSRGGLSLSELTAAIVERSEGRLRATLQGDSTRRIAAVAPLSTASASDLAFLANPRYRREAHASRAGAIVLAPRDAEALQEGRSSGSTFVVVDAPYAWFAMAAQVLHPMAERHRRHPPAGPGRSWCRGRCDAPRSVPARSSAPEPDWAPASSSIPVPTWERGL